MSSEPRFYQDARMGSGWRFVLSILLADDERLRPIWRFFLSAALLLAAFLVAEAAIGAVLLTGVVPHSFFVALLLQSLASLGAVIAVFKLMTAGFEHRPLGSVGLAFHSRWWKELGFGALIGAAMLFLAALLEWSSGLARFAWGARPTAEAGSFTFVLFAVAAINEEAVFRGYPFQRLVEAITPAGAIAVSSVLFGIAHLANPHRTWVSTLNTSLIGVPLAIAYLRTRSLWMPIGIHFAWNYLLGFFLGLPVSGVSVPASVLTARVGGPVALTGGQYGPEGGLLTTAAILAVAAYVLFSKRILMSEEMTALISAAMVGDALTTEKLLRAGADPRMADTYGRTAEQFACERGKRGNPQVCSLLKQSASTKPAGR